MTTDYGKWRENSSVQYDLRQTGVNTILMKRTADANGWDERGKPCTWLDVATFERYDEAVIVLAALHRDKERQQAEKTDGQAQPT